MNISQIRTRLRAAFNLGKCVANMEHAHLASSKEGARRRSREFDQSLTDLDDLPKLDWQEADSIRNIDTVDEALHDFTDDPTADAATILVQRIVAAYLKGQ